MKIDDISELSKMNIKEIHITTDNPTNEQMGYRNKMLSLICSDLENMNIGMAEIKLNGVSESGIDKGNWKIIIKKEN